MVNIQSIKREDISHVAELIGIAFAAHEPMCHHLGIAADTFAVWTRNLLESCRDDNMSFHIPGKAAIVSELIFPETVTRYVEHDTSMDPVFEFLQILGSGPTLKGKGLHIHLVATADDAVGRGLCKALCKHVVQKAKELKYDYILAELTTPATQHVFLDKLGFTVLKEICYDEYGGRFKGCPGKCVLAVSML